MNPGLLLALLLAPSSGAAPVARPVSDADVEHFFQILERREPEGRIWRTFHADFPAESRAVAAEAVSKAQAGDINGAMTGAHTALARFIYENTPSLAKAPDAAVVRYANTGAGMLAAVKSRSADACAAGGAGAVSHLGAGPEEAVAAVDNEIAVLDGIKAARQLPVDRSEATDKDTDLFADAFVKFSSRPQEAQALAGGDKAAGLPADVRCDAVIHMMQAAGSLPPATAGRVVADMLKGTAAARPAYAPPTH